MSRRNRRIRKLAGYQQLEAASGVRRWVLIWLPTIRRETEARRVLGIAVICQPHYW